MRKAAFAISVALVAPLLAVLPATAGVAAELTLDSGSEAFIEAAQERIDASFPELRVDLRDYRVVKNVPGDEGAVWILPGASAEAPSVTADSSGFQATLPSLAQAPGKDLLAAAVPTMSWQAAKCAARWTNTYGWMDRCTQWGHIVNDGDSSRDHWVFKTYATCKSLADWNIQTCTLSSKRTIATGLQYWEDWAPRADSSGNCRTVSVGVSAYGVSVSGSYSACDQVDITKGAAAGTFSNTFRTPSSHLQERSVQYQLAVGVPQGTLPGMDTSWGITGYLNAPV